MIDLALNIENYNSPNSLRDLPALMQVDHATVSIGALYFKASHEMV
jgi:hypothetical protein